MSLVGAKLAETPVMGWSTWNHFHCNINEKLIRNASDLLIQSGLAKAGYTFVNLDDCWSLKDRDNVTGELQADPLKFPSGIKKLADYLHSKGLKLGLYTDRGFKTCQGSNPVILSTACNAWQYNNANQSYVGFPGSLDHEEQDARTFARCISRPPLYVGLLAHTCSCSY